MAGLNATINRIGSPAQTRGAPARYAVSLLISASALFATTHVKSLHDQTPFLLSYAAVMLASWRGGLGPGILAGFVSLLGVNYFVHDVSGEFRLLTGPNAFTAIVFLGVAVMFSALNEARLRAEAQQAKLLAREQAAEERYRAVFDGVADAILVVDDDRRFTDLNAAALKLLGYEKAELLGKRSDTVVAPGAAWSESEFARFRKEGKWTGELSLIRKNGSLVPVEAMATVAPYPDGRMNLSALRDISERQIAQWQQQAILETVSHDLRNPLASIKLHVQLLLRRLRSGNVDIERIIASLETIERATERMSGQLDELQDAARLRSSHKLELKPEWIDLAALVQEAVSDAQSITPRHQIDCRCEPPTIEGEWDPVRLRRVLDNMLDNAIKYSPGGGRITVALSRLAGSDGEIARIEICDQGAGIPAADLPLIFDRYRRGSNAGITSGTGIGLFGVRRIVEGHGGTVTVESEVGSGSRFQIDLPLTPSSAPS